MTADNTTPNEPTESNLSTPEAATAKRFFAPKRSYEVTLTLWSIHCEECGEVVDQDYRSAGAAQEAFDNLRALEGRALCDAHWVDPDDLEVAVAASSVDNPSLSGVVEVQR